MQTSLILLKHLKKLKLLFLILAHGTKFLEYLILENSETKEQFEN